MEFRRFREDDYEAVCRFLAAADAAGEAASYCCLWVYPGADYAYVEPVCTVPAWRGRGAAKALLCQALRRAREKGAKRAYVISDQDFYLALGFARDRHYTFHWKTPGENGKKPDQE